MSRELRCILIVLSTCLVSVLQSQDGILIDESFSDWQSSDLLVDDPTGDGAANSIDFRSIWVANDQDYLYIRMQLGREINIQEDNDLVISIDTDNNPSTGFQVDGIGAEIRYFFGERTGFLNLPGQSLVLEHEHLGLVTLPTVSADEFELSIFRAFEHFGNAFSMGNTINIVVKDDRAQGDRVPDAQNGVEYQMSDSQNMIPDYTIDKLSSGDLRIMSYNILNDGLFNNMRKPAFGRILRSVEPEIIGFQEVRDFNSSETAAVVEGFLPSTGGEEWHHSKIVPDIVLVSRFPILQSFATDGNGIFKVQLPDREIVIIVAHLPCCDNNQERQNEADRIIASLRNAVLNPGVFEIPEFTPIMIIGDMNLVGDRAQRETLLTGDIANENLHGADFAPDWGSPLSDAKPFATGRPQAITWYTPFSAFSGGRLDYILYTGSVTELTNTYALDTESLSDAELNEHGLGASDASIASDHFALVSDFTFDVTGTAYPMPPQLKLSIAPNPASDLLFVNLDNANSGLYTCKVFSLAGILIRQFDIYKGHQDLQFEIDVSGLAAGFYICNVKGGEFSGARSFIVK